MPAFPTVPPASPTMPKAAAPPLAEDLGPPKAAVPGPRAAFLAHTWLAEQKPHNRIFTLAEVRWCMFNEVRLTGAIEAAPSPYQVSGVHALGAEWRAACDSYDAHRRDIEQASAERKRYNDRLYAEGQAMTRDLPGR